MNAKTVREVTLRDKLRALKNVLIVSSSCALQFSAFWCSVNLLSSVRIDGGLGMASQAVLYGAFTLAAITLPPLLISKIGLKNTVGCSMMLYSLDIAANLKPTWAVYMPTSIVTGLASGVFWSSSLTYTGKVAQNWCGGDGNAKRVESTVFAFTGILITFYQSSNIWGNVISYKMLKPENGYSEMNETSRTNISEICGVNFCDWYATGSGDILKKPSDDQMKKLSAVFVACAIASGLFVLLFADAVKTPGKFQNTKFKDLLFSTCRCLKNPYHLLLGPLVLLSGLDVCFLMSDFTKAYISCTWGVSHIGYVLVTYGVTSTIFAVVLGYAERKVDRFVFVVTGIVVLGGCIAALGFWSPSYNSKYFLFVVAGFWGLVDSILQGQVKALYGVFFAGDNEASFACLSMFEGLGYLLGYSYDSQLCVGAKLIILGVFTVVSLIGYVIAEALYRKRLKRGLAKSYSIDQIMRTYNSSQTVSVIHRDIPHGIWNPANDCEEITENHNSGFYIGDHPTRLAQWTSKSHHRSTSF